jgi:hypothetical protein
MTKSALAAILLCLSLSTIIAAAQSGPVSQIRIVSTWAGMGSGGGSNGELVIGGESGAYLANGKKIPDELIAGLLSAIDAPVIAKPDLASMGITQEWLNANAEATLEVYTRHILQTSVAPNYPLRMPSGNAAPEQRKLFLSSFKDLKNIERIISELFHRRWTDDYPNVAVTIAKNDGSVVTVYSKAPAPFMLPWVIRKDGKELMTYNADISRAVARLMPEGVVNKRRLSDMGLDTLSTYIASALSLEGPVNNQLVASICGRQSLADCRLGIQVANWVMDGIGESWESMTAENKAKPYLDQLRRSFSILNARMEPDRNGFYVRGGSDDSPMVPHLLVTLSQPRLPVLINASLPYEHEKVSNVVGFLKGAERLEDVMLATPWLKTAMTDHPDLRYELTFANDRFFGEKSMQEFLADVGPNRSLVDEIKAAPQDIGLLRVHRGRASEDYWLILPDRRMVIWRFSGEEPLLKWNTGGLTSGKCNSYRSFRCAGAVISPAGELVSN